MVDIRCSQDDRYVAALRKASRSSEPRQLELQAPAIKRSEDGRRLVLYTNPQSRGRIARWMLEEIGQPYRTEVLDYASSMKAPAYLAINPMGKVPALRHGDAVGDRDRGDLRLSRRRFPAGRLAPPPGDRLRAPYYRWLFFAAGPVEAAVSNKALGFVVPPERERMIGYGSIEHVMNALEAAVSRADYLGRRQLHRRRSLCRLRDSALA